MTVQNPRDGKVIRNLSQASGISGQTIYRIAQELRKATKENTERFNQ